MASVPVMVAILKSMKITAGLCFRAASIASRPLRAVTTQ
jgi:hypothetical protein